MGLNQGPVCPPGKTKQHLETFLVVAVEREVSRVLRDGRGGAKHLRAHSPGPPSKEFHPQMSMAEKLWEQAVSGRSLPVSEVSP